MNALLKLLGHTRKLLLSAREHLRRTATDAIGKIRVRSALNPILLLCLIVSVPALAAAPFFKNGAPTWCIVLIYLPVGVACVGFLFLLLFDRDKLQSEDWQLRKQSLELIQEKGDPIPINPASLELISNPQKMQIKDSSDGGTP